MPTLPLTIALALAVLALAVVAIWPLVSRPWRSLVATPVLVNLKSGTALQGALVRQRGPLLFLANATVLEPGREPVTADGVVVVDVAEVLFIQASSEAIMPRGLQ